MLAERSTKKNGMMRACSMILVMIACISVVSALSNPPIIPKVIVTGAAGRTGKRLFSLLHKHPKFDCVGLVRTEKSAKKLIKNKEINCGLDQVVVCDITELSNNNSVPNGLRGADSMVICTSAMPTISKASLFKAMVKVPINLVRRKRPINPRDLHFRFKHGQHPEKVDFEGQKAQVDLAKKLGINHVVLVSSMGGTDPGNFLNSLGKNADGTGDGDILIWKRKAEKYLINSDLHYTIIHPGGLTEKEDGVEQLILDVDDKLLASKNRSISRGDVANICLAALTVGRERCVSFDCTSRPINEGETLKPAEDTLKALMAEGKTADYSL
mmetsp:Transcript_50908/g.75469  ORF Transcript_50908/g.75469 Transcript_50908/m.75469 type:complete len:327 (-) Transcript_50908:217-1197(-)